MFDLKSVATNTGTRKNHLEPPKIAGKATSSLPSSKFDLSVFIEISVTHCGSLLCARPVLPTIQLGHQIKAGGFVVLSIGKLNGEIEFSIKNR